MKIYSVRDSSGDALEAELLDDYTGYTAFLASVL